MKRKKEEIKKEEKIPIRTKNILNIITPSGLEFTKTGVNLGENYGKIYTITRYPQKPDIGWLAPLCNLEGTQTVIEYQSIESSNLIAAYDSQIRNLKEELAVTKGESERQQKQDAIDDIKKMIKRIKDEPFGYVNIMLFVQDTTEKRLEARIRKVNSSVAVCGASTRHLTFRQKQAYKACSPYGIPDIEASAIGNRNMPISTLLGGFPMSATYVNDGKGFYFGKTKDGRLVILDMWVRGDDRTNSNWYIQGVPGQGKSAAIKLILTCEYGLGTKNIIMDPEKEYIELANNIGGVVIDCFSGKFKINPLQVIKSPTLEDEDEDELYKDEGYGVNDLALHLQNLKSFFRLYRPGIDEIKMSYLEKSLIEVYEEKGITWETDINTLKNSDYPTMPELYEYLVVKAKDKKLTARERNIYEELRDLLYSAGAGSDSFLWNSPTADDIDNDFIVLDTSNLVNTEDNVKNAQFYLLCTWLWSRIAKDREERVLVGIDEGYTVVDETQPYTIKFIRNMTKRDRKYNSGMLFITHSVVDILDPSVKKYGQAILDNSCYKLLMGTDGKNLKETTEILNLTQKEEILLASKQRGQGILFVGSTRLQINIDIQADFLKLFGKGGGK